MLQGLIRERKLDYHQTFTAMIYARRKLSNIFRLFKERKYKPHTSFSAKLNHNPFLRNLLENEFQTTN